MKRVTIFLAALLLFTSCYDDHDSHHPGEIVGAVIVGALFLAIFNHEAKEVDPSLMGFDSDGNLMDTTGDAYVQLLVDDEFVFIPFNAEKPIQISTDTPILRSERTENATKWIHILSNQLEGFVLHDLVNIKSSKSFDNKLFFKKGNEIREVDFNIQKVK